MPGRDLYTWRPGRSEAPSNPTDAPDNRWAGGKEPRWLVSLTRRSGGGQLSPERASQRVSAFAYGNILVLSVVVVSDAHSVSESMAAWLVLGTTVSTFAAHIFAHWLSHGFTAGQDGPEQALRISSVVRDAVPIISSGTVPFVILFLGSIDVIALFDPPGAQLCAAAVIIFRIAVLGIVVERLRGGASWRALVSGLLVASLATVITIVKIIITH
ncbi:hypothetical protein [Williamsia sp. D3]|uniref:hypothetical protein n=1 Tax=Williamsia sp. D3 TaxID=1313067 RepID=UPI0003D2C564|nr:hypothetical protein [Williamsia sp. D3]ETD31399.1 hypothetical protein W823_20225 [Williamsia sp. D3]